MAKILIRNLQNRVITFNGRECTILEGIHGNGQDWMHACGGKGRCTTCAFTILALEGKLSEPSAAELRFRGMGRLGEQHRLACQTRLEGEVAVRVPAANQLPHLTYEEG